MSKNGFKFKQPRQEEIDGEICFVVTGHGSRNKSYISIDRYEDDDIIGYATPEKSKVFEHPHNFDEMFEELVRELND